MTPLHDVGSAARVFGPAKALAWITLALMLAAVVYAVVISLANWGDIGV